MAGFEIALNDIPVTKSKATKAKSKAELLEFMPLQRDFAFVVDRTISAGEVVKAAWRGDRTLVAGVEVFDVYEGAGIAEGRKSVAISVTLQPRDKTLTEAEIDAVAGRIVAAVAQETGATLRG
jgi:phenylalanyl-tRNA synthetase beta chain